MHQRTLRRASATALAAVAAIALAACSSGDPENGDTAVDTPTPEATGAAESAAFPVTIEHVLGEITIDEEPQRIVTLGSHEHEYLYALGVAPVAVPVSWQGYENGTGPWADADRIAAGAEPVVFDPGNPYDAEAIAAHEPDLIIATYPTHELSQEEYDLLSGIAPVLLRPATDSEGNATTEWGVTLDDELAIIGQAVGKSEEAAAISAEVEAMFAEVRDAHPEWEGLTATVGFYWEGNAGVYSSNDTRNQFLARLGLDVDAIEGATDTFVSISAEQLDILGHLDVIVWQVATDPTVKDTIEGLPLFDTLDVTQRGGNLWLTEPILEGAFFANSPSSLQYSLDAFVPQLEAALDGDPATEIPEFSDAG